jgi:hypothetical protein
MDPRLQASIVPTPNFDRQKMKTATEIAVEKSGKETSHAFHWLLYKPQSHAVVPFPTNEQSRLANTSRVGVWNH